MSGFKSAGAGFFEALYRISQDQQARRRQSSLDGIGVIERARDQARVDAALQRQAERDRIGDERYNTERADKLLARADDQGQRYLANEREDVQRKEAERQRSMDTADAAGQRYQDSELRRQEADAQRTFQRGENEAQRANARSIAATQQSGRSGDKQTGDQRRTEGLLYRAQAARGNVERMEDGLNLWEMTAPSWATTTQGRRYWQAADQWIDSVLRDESGAAIGKDERASYYKTYFAQPNDDPDTIEQKREARDAAEGAMERKAGSSSGGSTGGRNKYRVVVE